ncbi:MAG: hypothetical protein GX600_05725 [Dehalococcoidia bacterium]|jgi:hypothetical protein|nr:hypothetical protein [Dehalococcoidia bacterium]
MAFFKTIEAVRILVLSGLLVLVVSVLLMLSCRCVPASGAVARLRKASWFQRLFKRHCNLWYVFVGVLVVHVVFAIGFVGVPF